MMKKRMTMKNPQNAGTYRLSELKIQRENGSVFGEAVNKLGRYEDLGTPEEFEELKKKSKI